MPHHRGRLLLLLLFAFSRICLCLTNCLGSCSIDGTQFYYLAGLQTVRAGSSTIEVYDPDGQNIGIEKILIIQMQGGTGLSIEQNENSESFGNFIDKGNVGIFEFNYIVSINTNCEDPSLSVIQLGMPLVNTYLVNQSAKFQVVIGVACNTVVLRNNITCPAWNGETGGIIYIEANELIMAAFSIDASGKGFRGGRIPSGECSGPEEYPLVCERYGGSKGESPVLPAQTTYAKCRGRLGSGGGGSPCNLTVIANDSGHGPAGGSFIGTFLLAKTISKQQLTRATNQGEEETARACKEATQS